MPKTKKRLVKVPDYSSETKSGFWSINQDLLHARDAETEDERLEFLKNAASDLRDLEEAFNAGLDEARTELRESKERIETLEEKIEELETASNNTIRLLTPSLEDKERIEGALLDMYPTHIERQLIGLDF